MKQFAAVDLCTEFPVAFRRLEKSLKNQRDFFNTLFINGFFVAVFYGKVTKCLVEWAFAELGNDSSTELSTEIVNNKKSHVAPMSCERFQELKRTSEPN